MTSAPPHPKPYPERAALFTLALLALALWLLLWRFAHTDLTLHTRGVQLATFFAAFAVFCGAVAIVWRLGSHATRRTLWLIVLVGVAMRITLAPVRPVTTWDVYRYLWEGKVVLAGENPYREAPISPRLSSLRDPLWKEVRFPRVPAAYPPVAQYVFALSRLLPTEPVVTLKLVLALFDVGTVLLLPGLLRRLGRPPAWVLGYAWHPLIVGEVVARGHLDSIGIFLLVLAATLLAGRRVEESRSRRVETARRPRVESRESRVTAAYCTAAGAVLAGSVLAKGYAVLAVPFFFIAARRRGWLAAGLLVAAAAAYAPFLSARAELVHGLQLYATRWQDYAPVYPLVNLALRPVTGQHDLVARRVLLVALGLWVLALLVVRRRQGVEAALDGTFLALAGYFVLTPVLYSWYLSWTVPFLCLRPRPAWLLLSGTIFAFYAHAYGGPHVQVWWVSVLQFAPPLVLALVLLARERRAAWAAEGPAGVPARAPGESTDEDQYREPALPRAGEYDSG